MTWQQIEASAHPWIPTSGVIVDPVFDRFYQTGPEKPWPLLSLAVTMVRGGAGVRLSVGVAVKDSPDAWWVQRSIPYELLDHTNELLNIAIAKAQS